MLINNQDKSLLKLNEYEPKLYKLYSQWKTHKPNIPM